MNALMDILTLVGGFGTPLVWILAIVLALIMLSRRGGKAEWFFLAGASLMVVNYAFGLLVHLWERQILALAGGSPGAAISRILSVQRLIGLAGTVCLVYAFWIKFKVTSHA